VVAKDWKKKNYDTSIKVSEATIQGLRDGKTFEGNVAKFKSGATAEQREAMNRFYGKNRVGAALGQGVATINKTYPANSYNVPNKTTNNPGSSYKGAGSTNYKAPKKAGPGFGSMAGDFVKNELLGVDDFTRSIKYAKQGNVKGMIKSGLTGQAELGLTAASLVGSFFTGGATGAALVGAKTAAVAGKVAIKQGAKQAGKHAAKSTAKTVVSKTAMGTAKGTGKVVSTLATGSIKQGAKNVGKGVVKAPRAAVGSYKARGTMTPAIKAAEATVKATSTASRTAAKAYKANKTQAAGKAAKGLGKSYDEMVKAGKTSAQAKSAAAKLKKAQAAKLAKGKAVRKGARRAQAAHVVVAVGSRKNGNK